jgi:hypothetical protein
MNSDRAETHALNSAHGQLYPVLFHSLDGMPLTAATEFG